MEIGENIDGASPKILPSLDDDNNIHWKDIEISLWKNDVPKSEIFPPSKGIIIISQGNIFITKPRSVREQIGHVSAGYPMVIIADVPKTRDGLQWCNFSLRSIEKVGHTILLKPKLVVDDNSGSYDLIIGREGKEFIKHIKNELGEHENDC